MREFRARSIAVAVTLLALALAAAIASALVPDAPPSIVDAALVCALVGGEVAVLRLLTETRGRDVADRELALRERRFRGMLDSAMDAIVSVDDEQRVVLFNHAAEAMFGWTRDEALGAPLARFIPARYRDAHAGYVAHFGETRTAPRRMGGSLRIVTGLRRDGTEFPIDASISQVEESGRRLYTVILRDVTARVAAEEALRRSKDELQALGAAAHQTREQEKSRIARELHDELGQLLTMLQMDVAWCKEKLAGNEPLGARLDRMATLLRSTIAATRRIAADLRPLMLDDLGLVPSLEWLAESFSQRTGITCRLAVDGEPEISKAHASEIFRIVQESLTNIAKHAQATRAEVSIARGGGDLVVRIEDDGVGFSPQAPRKPNSFGLFGLRERASLIGASATITSAPGEGTCVEVRMPAEAKVASE